MGLIEQLCAAGGGALDPDTFVGERSLEAARRAAGAASAMARALMAGEAAMGFCAIRPSGHHAEADRAMGFCLFNNIAIAAAHARARALSRAAIVDYNVHHGNGTRWSFYDDWSVLFILSHQYPFYPGHWSGGDTGTGAGVGFPRWTPKTGN